MKERSRTQRRRHQGYTCPIGLEVSGHADVSLFLFVVVLYITLYAVALGYGEESGEFLGSWSLCKHEGRCGWRCRPWSFGFYVVRLVDQRSTSN